MKITYHDALDDVLAEQRVAAVDRLDVQDVGVEEDLLVDLLDAYDLGERLFLLHSDPVDLHDHVILEV